MENLMNKAIKEARKAQLYENHGLPILSVKIGRNSPCECGSGKKAKHCCGTRTKYYQSKAAEKTK